MLKTGPTLDCFVLDISILYAGIVIMLGNYAQLCCEAALISFKDKDICWDNISTFY